MYLITFVCIFVYDVYFFIIFVFLVWRFMEINFTIITLHKRPPCWFKRCKNRAVHAWCTRLALRVVPSELCARSSQNDTVFLTVINGLRSSAGLFITAQRRHETKWMKYNPDDSAKKKQTGNNSSWCNQRMLVASARSYDYRQCGVRDIHTLLFAI